MSVPLHGYRTSRLLRSSGQSRVYEAIREADGHAVIAKVFELESEEVEARVEHEFALIEALDIDGVVKALSLQRVGDQLVLLLDRVPGVNLAEYTGREPLELRHFFSIAIQIAEVLGRVHARRIIHRDIKPTNLLIDPDTGQVFLADFGISVLLDVERRHIYDPAVLEGTLPYVSPEQTGRTGRSVDFRSDLYSLGVTFYELLAGRRPFEFTAPLELIHAHLARRPEPVHSLRPELPEGVSRLVMKLVEKAPEHRYQTAAGLAADLRTLRDLVELGQDGRGLVLGRNDYPRVLQLPHQLYGRTQERHELVDELERVMRSGVGRVMLLTGPPGVGKSSLLADFEGPVSGFGGYLARGKFDGFRELPYAGFVAAFTVLIDQLLTESEERLSLWRQRLNLAMGNVGRVVCELVPTLELVVGEQAPVPELEPREARNRLHLAVGRFLSAFCDDRPLVIVLDDLHFADRDSFALLRALIQGGRQGALLILGSFREREVEPGHPLRALIEALADHHRLRVMRLRTLSEDAVESLLADTLARSSAEVRRLARIVSRKTDNNPLFIRQFLTRLAEQGVLHPGERGWSWDEDAVDAAEIPDDVLEIMTAKLANLAEGLRTLLAQAACIGARFDVAELEVVSGRGRAALAPVLYELVETGLLTVIANNYRFAHDRIHDAAHAMLDEAARAALHWKVGRAELERVAARDPTLGTATVGDERLFELVDHLDAGLPSASPTRDQRIELATLNLRAGNRALGTAAYDAALRYLECGLSLVFEDREGAARDGEGAPNYELVVDLEFGRAQVLALSQRLDEATAAFEELLGWRLDIGKYGRVVARRVRLLSMEDKPEEALALGLEALARCGHKLPRGVSMVRATASMVRAWLVMKRYDTTRLLALPMCEDPRVGAVMEVAAAASTAAYLVDSRLLLLLVGLHVRLLVRHGFHTASPLALSQLAIGVGPGLGRADEAIRLSEQALALVEHVPNSTVRAPVEAAVYLFVWHARRPFEETLDKLAGCYERALESGDFEYAGFMGALGLAMHFDVGTHLRVVQRLSRKLEDDIGRWGSHEMALVAWMIRGLAAELSGRELEAHEDEDAEDAEISDVRLALDPQVIAGRGGSRVSVYATRINQAFLATVLGDFRGALGQALEVIDDIEQVMLGSWMIPRLALITIVGGHRELEASGNLRPAVHRAVRKARRLLAVRAKQCPANYGHYRDLCDGLQAAQRGRPAAAMAKLEWARTHASEQGCLWVAGLAAELLADLAVSEGLAAFATGARAKAYAIYASWGAGAKLAQLRTRYPMDFGELSAGARDSTVSRSHGSRSLPALNDRAVPRSSATSAEALDFESVLQAVRVMTEDLRLGEVVGRVLEAAITNAGADRGMLLLERGGILGIVASAGVDGHRELFGEPRRLSEAEQDCPTSLVHFIMRTEQALVIDDARTDPRFSGDPYVVRTGVQSLLGMPILKGKRHLGALVLENRLSAYCFTPERLEGLGLIAGQAASALDNARLYSALRQSEARWRSLVDGAPDIIALLNERGEVEFVNRSSLVDVGEGGETGGRLLEMFLSSASATDWRAAVEAVLGRGSERELEIEVLREGQEPRWYVARLAPVELAPTEFEEFELEPGELGDRAGVRHAVVVATDITERKRAEVEKQALEAQLRQQQRLESVGTLASGVAHEINNPVQGILNYAELIGENLSDHETVAEFAQEIMTESNRVATIVRNLLQFSRQEREARMEETKVIDLVDATLSLIRAVLRRDHIQIQVEIPDDLPKVSCRIQQIQQILMNLVTNARDALNQLYAGFDERKVIVIRAEHLPPRGAGSKAKVRIIVEDHGPGIPADVLGRIFDPFFTTKGRDQGTGLGLSVSHGIAQDHGGELSVETRVGEWTRFRLDLPLDTSS